MNEKRYRLTRRFGPWSVAVFLLAASVAALGMGATPRYIEELRIGGGWGDTVDGGADFEADGDILTDGTLSIGGAVAGVGDGSLTVKADTDVVIQVDADNDGSESLQIKAGDGTTVAEIDELGHAQFEGDLTVMGNHIKDSGGAAALTFDGNQNVSVSGSLSITGAGDYIYPYANIEFQRNNGDAYIRAYAGYDLKLVCGDNAGTNAIVIRDSGGNDQGKWDSDGTITLYNGNVVVDSDAGMVKFGEDLDFQLRYELAGSDHYWKVEDGSGNDMLTVKDNGTVGEVGVTGTLDVDGRIEYVNSGVVTLDGVNPTPVDFTDEGGIDMPDATYAVLISAETTGNPITATWANRSTTGFEVSAWNVSTGNPSTSSTLRVSWMVVDQ